MHASHEPAFNRSDSFLEPDEDNMFTVLKTNNRGSGSSNTTKTVSTDNSSRRSDTSTTPPSSTVDLYEDPKSVSKKTFSDIPVPPIPKTPASNIFLKTAGRTFSFGQKKTATPPTSPTIKEPEWQEGDDKTQDRAMTASTSIAASSVGTATATAIAPKLEDAEMDMGNDFNTNMFKGIADRRASVIMPLPGDATKPKPAGESRPAVPAPLQIDKAVRVEAPPASWNSQSSNDKLLADTPPLPRQASPATDMTDDDTALLTDTLLASKWLGADQGKSEAIPMTTMRGSRRGLASTSEGFLQSPPSVRPAHRFPPKDAAPSQTKVMTPAQFERYRLDKERQGKLKSTDQREASDDEDDKYDDEEDEAEKTRQAAKDRNKRQAHMTLYRQQMTKVTGETPDTPPSSSSVYPGMSGALASSSTSNLLNTPPPELVLASEDDGDDDIPLGILQQHGFPSKTRPPMRAGMRASYMAPTPRAQSSLGGDAQRNNRHSALPAFARNLPQDPFIGASVAQPPIRESLPYGGGMPSPPQPQTPGQVPVGGLVGVIMNEERSRAMRRGSPQPQTGKFGSPLLGYDPSLQMPPAMPPPQHSMYSLNPMAAMSQPSLSQPTYGQDPMMKMQMQLLQMQMAQMQMMQGGNMTGMAPQMSMGQMGLQDPSAIRHSVATDSLRERPRFDAGSRTMSMVQPSSASWVQPAPSIRISGIPGGYTPSIAPSERSTMGMPGRYRPVSQMIPTEDPRRASAMPGSLGQWESLPQSKSEPRLSTTTSRTGTSNNSADSGSKSDDEDEGWAALKAKREKTKSTWKKKSSSLGANTFMSGIL
jgi:hypothetical protein